MRVASAYWVARLLFQSSFLCLAYNCNPVLNSRYNKLGIPYHPKLHIAMQAARIHFRCSHDVLALKHNPLLTFWLKLFQHLDDAWSPFPRGYIRPRSRELVANHRHPAPWRSVAGSVLESWTASCVFRIPHSGESDVRVPGDPFGSTPLADSADLAGKG